MLLAQVVTERELVVGGVITIIAALVFDYTNGFHDAANSIATVVSTRVLSPRLAVLWAAFWNFVAFLILKTEVAKTIAKGVVQPFTGSDDAKVEVLTIGVIFAGLVGAIIWNLITFFLGLPTSSSHALVGGMAGAAVARFGTEALINEGLFKIAVFIFMAPVIGMALGMTLSVLLQWVFHKYRRVDRLNRGFRIGQLLSAGAYSLGHGGNDAQKTMGIIWLVLITSGKVSQEATEPPLWVVLAAHTAIGLGTLAGGWRIVKTLGSRITRLQPSGGVAAETGAAITLFFATANGIPVSTTHTITGAIVGVGTSKRLSAVRWGIASKVIVAWLVTIPGAALISGTTSLLVEAFN